jgi:alcohol dehydrogenase (cytochrome c)
MTGKGLVFGAASAAALGLLLLPAQEQGPVGLITPPPGPGGGVSPYVTVPPAPKRVNPLERLTPVTDALLIHPPESDWLTWRRTYDDWGFSPLRQINRANAGNLRLAWSWSLPPGPNEMTPLVHDGVLFVFGYGDKVQALDAATGDLLWQYSRPLPQGMQPSVKRNLALYENRLYVPTSDAHLVALDIKTGRVVWDHVIADHKMGFNITGGPLVAKGKVMQGVGGRAAGGNFIAALDAKTGEEAWRFYTIARPGEPGGNTWNGLPLEKRNGASVWTAGSYDPDLNLVFFGVAQTYDTGPLLKPVNQPGVSNEGLYTDCTLAINPDTGKLAWYYQHVPNDQWDLDWVFERQLIPLPVNGVTKELAVTSGKMAIYEGLEAATGKYAFSMDLGLQNVVSAIDPKTGAKTINPKTLPGDGETKLVCPHAGGSKNWVPGSYDPNTNILYVSLVESCMDLIPVTEGRRPSLSSGVRWAVRPRLDSDGNYGRVEAINLATRKVVWTERQRVPITTGVLATAGGVLFEGSMDRRFRARDDSSGKVLWETRLNDVPNAAPISYTVNGKQYVAITVGNGGAIPSTWWPLIPDIQNPTDRSASVWVFELPQ